MAIRPLVFGVLMREKGRSVRLRSQGKRGYVVEDSRRDGTRRRNHPSLSEAMKDFAATWRGRLN